MNQRFARRGAPPEDSLSLRAAAWGAVVVSVIACAAEGEIGAAVAVAVVVTLTIGSAFSYVTRRRPWRKLRPVIAVLAVAAFIHFFLSISTPAEAGGLSSVTTPLALLFSLIQVAHAFDVPARRDLLFTFAGSVTLMAVAATQAVNESFGIFVIPWAFACVYGLMASWTSMTGGGPVPTRTVAAAGGTTILGALVLIVALPAPQASRSLVFPATSRQSTPVANPGGLAGGGGDGSLPARPGKTGGAFAVGGYLGFAGPLDTALRGQLGNEVVMRVRATRPAFFAGETYDHWDGQSWTSSSSKTEKISGGPSFNLEGPISNIPANQLDVQTFYAARPLPNLVFAADTPVEVWFPSSTLYVGVDHSIRTGIAITQGTIYTVVSNLDRATPAQMRATTNSKDILPADQYREYTQLPGGNRYARAHALALAVTQGHASTYGKVVALEGWMADHLRYSTDIPPLPQGADAVNNFLFGSRVGYCEQISTALAVMLRGIGIPAREAVGYVPGPYNPITDLYDIEAKDAHAWVQVWFPGLGWQNFDPTASVPLANPSPGQALLGAIGRGLGHLPLVPLGAVLAAAASALAFIRIRRGRSRTWAEQVTRAIERAGKRAGRTRRASETLAEYAACLDLPPSHLHAGGHLSRRVKLSRWARRRDARRRAKVARLRSIAALADRSAYAGREPDVHTRIEVLAFLVNLRLPRLRMHPPDREPTPNGTVPSPGGTPGPQELASFSASSKDAPSASSLR